MNFASPRPLRTAPRQAPRRLSAATALIFAFAVHELITLNLLRVEPNNNESLFYSGMERAIGQLFYEKRPENIQGLEI